MNKSLIIGIVILQNSPHPKKTFKLEIVGKMIFHYNTMIFNNLYKIRLVISFFLYSKTTDLPLQ
jgi:hypothetical protein